MCEHFRETELNTNSREGNKTIEEANSASNLLGLRNLRYADIDEGDESAGEEAE